MEADQFVSIESHIDLEYETNQKINEEKFC